jgi:hypothetical protein
MDYQVSEHLQVSYLTDSAVVRDSSQVCIIEPTEAEMWGSEQTII